MGMCSTPKAPDTRPLAEASEKSAQLAYDLGMNELNFAQQQYSEMAPFFKELTEFQRGLAEHQMGLSDRQAELADETAAQGREYYEYQKSFRPVEQQMLGESMVGRAAEIAAFDAANQADAAKLTQNDAAVYAGNRGEIDQAVGTAIADTQGAFTRTTNQAMRQGLRYGASPAAIASEAGGNSIAQASMQASAANGARAQAVGGVRQRIATGLQLRQGNMSSKNQQQAIDWARKLDAAGLVKGISGASQGAYGLAISAGNAAGQNTQWAGQNTQWAGQNGQTAGNNLLSGMHQSGQTVQAGQNSRITGLGGILNNQTSMYNQASNNQSEMFGTLIGAGVGLYPSDIRLKDNIERVGTTVYDLPLYTFNYIGDDQRYQGVMAQDVLEVLPEAVLLTGNDYLAVDYAMLGIEMTEVN